MMANRTSRHPLGLKQRSPYTHSARFGELRPWIEGRSVLDLGAGGGIHRPDWLHSMVTDVATDAVGVELDPDLVERAEQMGFELVCADAQDLDLGRTFDVVLAGELIEHLDCMQGFLTSASRHLSAGGVLLVTTPNPFAVSNFVYRLWDRPVRVNPGHTGWLCEDTIAHLYRRFGFEVTEVRYLAHETPGRLRRVVATAARAPLPPRLRWRTMLVAASKRGESS